MNAESRGGTFLFVKRKQLYGNPQFSRTKTKKLTQVTENVIHLKHR